jgi:ABC-2 type transport system ATP-binding protein
LSQAGATLSTSGLGKQFGDQWAVRDVTLDVSDLRVVGLVGPSGSGKTTLVRMLNGAIAPDAGEVRLLGSDPRSFSRRQQQRIGYLPQQAVLFPELSLWENLNFHASLAGVRFRRRARLRELLDFVDLGEHRKKKVHESSGGMQRRLALAATLVHRPEVLFLDEPTAGIDPILRRRIWERFRDLRDEGTLLVVTTQYVGEAAYCDDVGVLSDGQLLALCPPDELRRNAYGGDVVEITSADVIPQPALDEVARLEGVVAMERPSITSTLVTVADAASGVEAISALLARHGVTNASVDAAAADYDDVFVRIVERHRSEGRDDEPAEATMDMEVAT